MKSNYCYYYNNILKDIVLTKMNLVNIYNIPKISSVNIMITFSNQMILEDLNIIKAMLLLELVSTQKTNFKKIRSIFRNKKQLLIFAFMVTLRKIKMYNFLHLLINDIIPQTFKHYIIINKTITKTNIYQFAFNDMNVLPDIYEKYIKWPYNLNIQIFPNKINRNTIIYKSIFQFLKLPII